MLMRNWMDLPFLFHTASASASASILSDLSTAGGPGGVYLRNIPTEYNVHLMSYQVTRPPLYNGPN